MTPYVLPGSEAVLATVNGAAITRYDFEQALGRGFSELDQMVMDDAARGDLLELLLRAKALAQLTNRELTPYERIDLDRRAARFREKELVRAQLEPEPVPNKLVEAFYKQHPEKFGGRANVTCELISSERPLNAAEQNKLVQLVAEPGARANWSEWTAQLKVEAGFPLVYRQQVQDRAMHPKLREALMKLAIGKSSSLFFLFDTPFIIRRVSDQTVPPRPLSEVEDEIRVTLAPTQLTKAVERASDDAMTKVKVRYRDEAN